MRYHSGDHSTVLPVSSNAGESVQDVISHGIVMRKESLFFILVRAFNAHVPFPYALFPPLFLLFVANLDLYRVLILPNVCQSRVFLESIRVYLIYCGLVDVD